MNTPIERIQELADDAHSPEGEAFGQANENRGWWDDGNINYGFALGFYEGFRACEKRYQELWQEFIESLSLNMHMIILTEKAIAINVFTDFQKWLEDKQNGK